MKCKICKKEAINNSVVCSAKCNEIRLKIIKLINKYTPTNGCENCWGDLMIGCTDKCKNEFKLAHEFANDIYFIVRLTVNVI